MKFLWTMMMMTTIRGYVFNVVLESAVITVDVMETIELMGTSRQFRHG
jgi:hypothetical protein